MNPARDLGPRILSAMAGYGRGRFQLQKVSMCLNPRLFENLSCVAQSILAMGWCVVSDSGGVDCNVRVRHTFIHRRGQHHQSSVSALFSYCWRYFLSLTDLLTTRNAGARSKRMKMGERKRSVGHMSEATAV